jgi:hypothetical protein
MAVTKNREPIRRGQSVERLATCAPYDHADRGARPDLGAAAYSKVRSGFLLKQSLVFNLLCLYLADLLHFWGILGIFGGQILGGSWG